jgi:SulP family sulfate permease
MNGLKVSRQQLMADAVAGMVMAIVTVPGALANGLLAGVNPVYGVYSVIAGTTVAAVFTGSVIMNVDSTSATSLATNDFVGNIASGDQLGYLVVLGILVGLFMLGMGLLKLGFLTNFISNSVMTGFLSGLGVLTILGQVGDITGYASDAPNRVARLIDTIRNWQEIDPATFVAGMLTILIIVLLQRTRYERFALPIALALMTAAVAYLPAGEAVALVGDTTTVPRGLGALPRPNLPDLALIPSMLLPAITIAIIALVQAAGVSKSVPNPDGEYPDPSRDFVGQGAANLSAGIFGGIAVGGSLSGTGLIRSCGGTTRWANIFTGVFAAVLLVAFAPLIEKLPLTALAGMLVVVGFQMIRVEGMKTVWQTGRVPAILMMVTFVATLYLPLQAAVGLGVALSVLLHAFRSAERVRLERIVPSEGGGYHEEAPPTELSSNEIVALLPIGSLFFAGAAELEDGLPDVGDAHGATVMLSLRDREEVGSTFVQVIRRYAQRLQAQGNTLMLVSVTEAVHKQLEATGIAELVGAENLFPAEAQYGASMKKAWEAAEARTVHGGES